MVALPPPSPPPPAPLLRHPESEVPTCPCLLPGLLLLPPGLLLLLLLQVTVINADYNTTGIRYWMKGAMYWTNANWTADCLDSLPDIYNTVVQSPATQVNVIVCDLASVNGILG